MIPHTCSSTIGRSFLLGYLISGLSKSEIFIVYLVGQHWCLGYPNPGLNRFKISIVYLCANLNEVSMALYGINMVYLCRPCFLRYQVNLQSSAQCGVCASQLEQHAQVCLELSPTVLPGSMSATESPPRQGLPLQNCQSGPTWWSRPAVHGPGPSRMAIEARQGDSVATFLQGNHKEKRHPGQVRITRDIPG